VHKYCSLSNICYEFLHNKKLAKVNIYMIEGLQTLQFTACRWWTENKLNNHGTTEISISTY